jgi:nucleotide-binding universal stress UspA family protein
MSDPQTPNSLQRIFHPTDFSPDGQIAFAHALKLALLTRAELTIMHVDPKVAPEGFEDFPRVRPTLEQWGTLKPGSSKRDVLDLGLQIKKVRALADDPKLAIIHHLTAHPTDLMVLSTHQHGGFTRLFHDHVGGPVSRAVHVWTLFVPTHVQGFVSLADGHTSLHRLLLPISADPPSQQAIDAATVVASKLAGSTVQFTLVHAGDKNGAAKFTLPSQAGWQFDEVYGKGNPVDWILAAGDEFDVDLIAMATKGHDSVLDFLRGSTTERVLRGARCPLLAIPV